MNACGCSFGRGHWSCPLAGTRDSLWWWSRRSRGASRSSHRPTVASQRWSRTAGAGSCSRPGTPPASRKPCEPSARPKPRGGWAGTPERSTSDATRRSGTSIGSWASTPGRSRPPRRERRNEVRPVSAEADARPRSRWRIRQVVALGWTGLDQLLSSVSNVVVSLAVARAAGVDGLGAYPVAFAVPIVVLGFQRALITEPLLAIPASEGPDGHPRRALGAVAMLAVGSATALVLGGLLSNRSELVALAAVIAFVCLQDAYRYVLFRRRRAHLAAVIDAVWLIASVAGWPLITSRGTATTAVLVWGIGAGLSALLGARIAGVLPSPGRAAIRWWSREARPLGGFLALTSIVYAVGGQVTVLGLATVLGEGALGELRAAQILFGPIALATTAISFFALPRLAAARERLSLRVGGGVRHVPVPGGPVALPDPVRPWVRGAAGAAGPPGAPDGGGGPRHGSDSPSQSPDDGKTARRDPDHHYPGRRSAGSGRGLHPGVGRRRVGDAGAGGDLRLAGLAGRGPKPANRRDAPGAVRRSGRADRPPGSGAGGRGPP